MQYSYRYDIYSVKINKNLQDSQDAMPNTTRKESSPT